MNAIEALFYFLQRSEVKCHTIPTTGKSLVKQFNATQGTFVAPLLTKAEFIIVRANL